MTWLWIWLIQAAIVTVIATRIFWRLSGSAEGPGDAATMGLLFGLFWPVGLVVMVCLFGVHFIFEGLGRLITIGSKGSP